MTTKYLIRIKIPDLVLSLVATNIQPSQNDASRNKKQVCKHAIVSYCMFTIVWHPTVNTKNIHLLYYNKHLDSEELLGTIATMKLNTNYLAADISADLLLVGGLWY